MVVIDTDVLLLAMDSLALNLAERTPGADRFVTWNARHFRGKSSLLALNPEEYLAQVP